MNMKKRDVDEEEIPLTHITDVTRAKFDSLLKSALNGAQQGEKKKGRKRHKRHVTSEFIEQKTSGFEDDEEIVSNDSRYSSPVHVLKLNEDESAPSGGYYNSVIEEDSDDVQNEFVQNEELVQHLEEHTRSSINSSPQHRGNWIDVEADIEQDNSEGKNAEERFPLQPKRPIPLPRIKTGKRNKDKTDSETNQISDDTITKEETEDEADVIEEHKVISPSPVKQKPATPVKRSQSKTERTELTYEKIIGVYVHRCGHLTSDPIVTHPVVRVHLVNADTGEYLKKSDPTRSVSFFYENKEHDYIQPLTTGVFDFKSRKSFVPSWEELLLFNEDVQCILQDDPPVLVMFEILDFVSSSVASKRYKKLGSEGGWHKVAWAYLRPVSSNGDLNVDKKLRLQLYQPRRYQKFSGFGCRLYAYWMTRPLVPYPSTLYVTVAGLCPPRDLPPVLRSRLALQEEYTADLPGELWSKTDAQQGTVQASDNVNLNSKVPALLLDEPVKWSRLPAQSCKIPNQQVLSLPTLSHGCMGLKFNPSGRLLACAMEAVRSYPIVLFIIPDGVEYASYEGHWAEVYDLHWSSCGTMLLSASGDCTARIWDVSQRKNSCLQMLPHPDFVYCAAFHPARTWLIATGCSDHVVRLWSQDNIDARYELVQELEGHTGFVSALCFNKFGELISGDSEGIIEVWTCLRAQKHFSPWALHKSIVLQELQDTVINKLVAHPGGQRLLVHGRDSMLRMVHLATGTPIQWYRGAVNDLYPTSACLSPCGGLVFAASEDKTVVVWNVDTGEKLATYTDLGFEKHTYGVDYHPFEHMAAFCSYGSSGNVLVCSFSKQATGLELGLQYSLTQKASNSELNLIDDLKSKKKKKKMKERVLENCVIPSKPQDLTDSQTNLSWNNESLRASSRLSVDKSPEVPKLDLARIIYMMDEVLSVSSSRSVHTIVSETNVSQTSSLRSAARRRRDRKKIAESRSGSQ